MSQKLVVGSTRMRKPFGLLVLLAALALPPLAMAQGNTPTQSFDPHDLSGVWQFAAGGGGHGPGDNFPPLTPWGKAKYDANKPGYGPRAAPGGNDPILKCDPTGFPRILFQIWPFEIIQIPGRILMFFEGQHTIRPIWMDGRKLPNDPDPTWYGHSIGRFEGNTLVVDTVGFNDRFWFDFKGHPHTERLHIVERYTRKDYSTLVNQITIDDPGAYSRPFTVTFTAELAPAGDELMEYICSENNQDVPHIQGPPTQGGDPDRPLGTLKTR